MTGSISTDSSASPGYLVPGCFRETNGLIALQSTRLGGVSEGAFSSLNLGGNSGDRPDTIHGNMLRLCSAAGIGIDRLVSGNQVHGCEILYAEKPGHYDGYDAFVTDISDLFLCIFTADCYPVLIYDPTHKAVGAAHAGWKGTAGKIVMKTVDEMNARFNSEPSDCIAYIGAGISAANYEVGREVCELFPEEFCLMRHFPDGRRTFLLDLAKANRWQLLESGITETNIEESEFCTFRDRTMFYSYRRDNGITGRMVSLVGMTSGR